MKQIMINGHLVNVIEHFRNHIAISFNEAERLITSIPDLGFVIYERLSVKVLTRENLDFFRRNEDTRFLIRAIKTEGIADSGEIDCSKVEVGFNCIDSIKAHVDRLGGSVDYDDDDIREAIPYNLPDEVRSMRLQADGKIVVSGEFRGERELSSMLANEEITVDELHWILIGLEKIDPLLITTF